MAQSSASTVVVGDHHGFGGACEKVDADAAVKLAFGFGDEDVAGTDEHVDGIYCFSANRHGADGLHASKDEYFVRAAHMHGRDDGRVRLAFLRRGRGDDAGHAGDGRGQHGHVGRGHHREFAAGDVAANGLHGDVFVPQNHAGQRFNFDVGHRGALGFGKGADLRLGEFDVVHIARADLLHGRVNFGLCEAEAWRFISVKFGRQVANGGVTARFDVFQRRLDDSADACVIFGPFAFRLAGFEVGDGHALCPDFGSMFWCWRCFVAAIVMLPAFPIKDVVA